MTIPATPDPWPFGFGAPPTEYPSRPAAPDLTEVAQCLGLLAHLRKRIAEVETPLREAFLDGTDEGDVKKPKMPGVDKPIATISHTQGTPAREEWIVSDRGALLAWARAVFPDAVVTPPPVQPPDYLDPEFEDDLLATVRLVGETDVPGIAKKRTPATPGTVTVRPDMKLADAVWAAAPLTSGLAFAAALEAPSDPETQQ